MKRSCTPGASSWSHSTGVSESVSGAPGVEQLEQRQVAAGDRLPQPLLAERPRAEALDVGHVRVQHDRQRAAVAAALAAPRPASTLHPAHGDEVQRRLDPRLADRPDREVRDGDGRREPAVEAARQPERAGAACPSPGAARARARAACARGTARTCAPRGSARGTADRTPRRGTRARATGCPSAARPSARASARWAWRRRRCRARRAGSDAARPAPRPAGDEQAK